MARLEGILVRTYHEIRTTGLALAAGLVFSSGRPLSGDCGRRVLLRAVR
jgi:hypothetical protein